MQGLIGVLKLQGDKIHILIKNPSMNESYWGPISSEDLLSEHYGSTIEYPDIILRMLQAYSILTNKDVDSAIKQFTEDMKTLLKSKISDLQGHKEGQKDNSKLDMGTTDSEESEDDLVTIKVSSWISKDKGIPREITGVIEKETPKAVLFNMEGSSFWIPKSQMEIKEE